MTFIRNRLVLTLCICVAALGLVACQPRGESKSVQQILDAASLRYRKAFDGQPLPEDVASRLPQLSKALETLVKGGDAKQQKDSIDEVVDHLRHLTAAAGYTSRPALGAITEQYTKLKQASDESIALLVAKTFSTIASELEGIRFQLFEREKKQ